MYYWHLVSRVVVLGTVVVFQFLLVTLYGWSGNSCITSLAYDSCLVIIHCPVLGSCTIDTESAVASFVDLHT
jgi:hypothetical protein